MDSLSVKMPRTEQNTVCFSGHRHLSRAELPMIHRLLRRTIRECWNAGFRWFICGGALGFDTLSAEAVIAFRNDGHPEVGLFLALPCADQASRWPDSDRCRYRQILQAADDSVILSSRYFPGCMQMRNRFMVDHASVCVCYLRQFSGGTGYTVRYALSCRRRIVNLCIPDADLSVRVKEPSWNCMFTSPSACANVRTVRLNPLPVAAARKWKGICLRFSGRRSSEKLT